jgi:hypothetical protein
MRKCLLLFIFYMPFFSFLQAQQFKAGLLAGIVTSQVDGDTYAGYNKAGLILGGFVTKKITTESKWSVFFEITYIQKGSRKIPHVDKGDFADYKLKLNYIEVPLMLKYDFSDRYSMRLMPDSTGTSRMKFAVFGGFAFGTLINFAEWDAFGSINGGTSFQKIDIPIILGLSYSLSKHIGFDIRTQYSLLPIRKGNTSSYYQNWTYQFFKPGYYNNLIIFSLNYKF